MERIWADHVQEQLNLTGTASDDESERVADCKEQHPSERCDIGFEAQ
jgi:hypothetical protein